MIYYPKWRFYYPNCSLSRVRTTILFEGDCMITKRKGEWLEMTAASDWEGLSIEVILKELWQMPKGLLHQFRVNKRIKCNGKLAQWNSLIQNNDRLQFQFFIKEDYGVHPEFMDINVLYEDDHLVIVNKPAGIDTHPTEKGQGGTLANAVAFHWLTNGVFTKVRHIHRLDRDTTGAVLFAKHALAGAMLDRMLEDRLIKRTYVAMVHGKIKPLEGYITAPIGRDRHHATKRRVSTSGKSASTFYKILDVDHRKNISLVTLQLQTGRTHQIRAHMSYIGHPLVGDTLYGGSSELSQRQALHAANLTLTHPFTANEIRCQAPFVDNPPIFPPEADVR